MHNQRREHFFQGQRRARARDLILDRYIAERLAQHRNQKDGEAVGAAIHVLPGIGPAGSGLRCAVS